MRIATWNLERPCTLEKKCPPHIVAEIEAVPDVDVWILTEVHAEGTDLKGFDLITQSAPTPGERNWTGIWVRRGSKANKVEVCSDERTQAACVFLPATDVGPLYVYGSVLIAHDGIPYKSSLANQKEDWQRIRRQEPCASFCFGGDLNKELSNRGVKNGPDNQRLRDALSDSYLTCLTAEIKYSFEDRPGEHKFSIDHICISQSLTSSSPAFLIPDECSFRIPKNSTAKERTGHWYTAKNERLSDHHGVVATVVSR